MSFFFYLTGKVWFIVMVFLRILILLFAGYPLYQDEQERFVCNTIQPGCANVCYDLFSPISLFRFWLVQLITLCLPYVIFVIYVVHKVSNSLSMAMNSPGHSRTSQQKVHQESSVVVEQRWWSQSFTGAYILHLLLRTLLEAGFGAAHYYLFGFYIPRRFLCHHAPCTTQVDCYISRPTEKTVMLNFMLGLAALCLFLNVLDFICAIKRSVKQKRRRKVMVGKVLSEEQSFLSAGVVSRGTDSNISLSQRDPEAQSGKSESFRKRHSSRSSSGGETVDFSPGPPLTERCSYPCSPGHPDCSTNRNNGCLISQEEPLERNGSDVALCPQETTGTPKSIRVNKRCRLKPPPPPRRDLGLPAGRSAASAGDVSTVTALCTRRVGQYKLVELGNVGEDGQENRSEWV